MEINHTLLCAAFLAADLPVTVCLHLMHAIHYLRARDAPSHLTRLRYINEQESSQPTRTRTRGRTRRREKPTHDQKNKCIKKEK
ncbi:hypothetical protein E2C01_095693 [Portunus trituberculatus]|uniref:Uncharacterized protein n=1 Tax=Portunus trituberculatus TaxID=210409 RepID=A0A5B7JVX9_PORTR|nr:hypothetical protein [Portunus trituberculatus]